MINGGEKMKERLMRYRPLLTYFAIYSGVFLLLARFALYCLPFVIAVVIAVVMRPLYSYLRRRFRFRSAFTATTITLLIFGALAAIAAFLLYLIALQAISLFDTYGYLIEDYFASDELFRHLRDALLSGSLLTTVTDAAALVIRVVPLSLTFVIITFALTVFFLNRLGQIKTLILKRVGDASRDTAERVLSAAYRTVRRFIRSYLVLYLVTFVEAVFIFYLTGVPYPLPFAFITAVADILPVLGPGTVYIPFAVIFILQKNYIAGVTLLVFFLLTVILRQILEPRVVSDSVKVHPLVVLFAIYCSIAAMNLWVLFYVVLLFLGYKVLREAGVLTAGVLKSGEE